MQAHAVMEAARARTRTHTPGRGQPSRRAHCAAADALTPCATSPPLALPSAPANAHAQRLKKTTPDRTKVHSAPGRSAACMCVRVRVCARTHHKRACIWRRRHHTRPTHRFSSSKTHLFFSRLATASSCHEALRCRQRLFHPVALAAHTGAGSRRGGRRGGKEHVTGA